MIKTKKKLITTISLLFVVACFGGKNITDNNIIINYSKLHNRINIRNNNDIYKVKLDNKNIIKGEISHFIHNNDLFVISNSKHIVKISLNTQNIEWIKELSTTPYNNIVCDNNGIYFNGIDNNFYILNYNTGEIEGIFFNINTNTVFNIKQPYIYKNYIVAFFVNNEFFIINKTTKKIVKSIEYDTINIQDNTITINDNKIINLDNLGDN